MFRISLRELFAFVACCAFALVSLKYASQTWLQITLSLAMIAFLAAIVVAAIDRGPRQAFCLAFVLVVITYGWFVLKTPRYPGSSMPGRTDTAEFRLWDGLLPTTRLPQSLYNAAQKITWTDSSTGKELVDFDPKNPSIPLDPTNGGGLFGGNGGGFMTGGPAPAGPTARYFLSPAQEDFAYIGHLWWAMLLGFIGGRFGQFIYTRRTSNISHNGVNDA